MTSRHTKNGRFVPSPLEMICVANPETLLADHHYQTVWEILAALNLPRRVFAEAVVDILRDIDRSDVKLVREYAPREFDEIFSDDESRRWFGEFLKPCASGDAPDVKSTMIERLEIMDAVAKFMAPERFKITDRVIQ